MKKYQCPQYVISQQVSNALNEDVGLFPDWTSELIKSGQHIVAMIKTNQDMLLCGDKWANESFFVCDKNIKVEWYKKDGDQVLANENICRVTGDARAILTAERTVLNFLQTLSATATIVNRYVELVKSTAVKIMDTRKTIPGLRLSQKYAVGVGGGFNQRFGLYDGILIKENHIIACGGVKEALFQAFLITPEYIPVQIEVEDYVQLEEALSAGAKLILLDNMPLDAIRKCVELANGQAELEVSGNINLDNVLEYAQTGIDRISIGGLTKNIQAIDLSMRVVK